MSFTAVAFELSAAQLAALPDGLIGYASSAFSRNRQGKLGFGEHQRFTARGANRFATVQDRWTGLTQGSVEQEYDDGITPSAPTCFVALTFDHRSDADSVVTVPKFVLERTQETIRLQYIFNTEEAVLSRQEIFTQFLASLPTISQPHTAQDFTPVSAHMSPQAFQQAVSDAVDMLEHHELQKIVLARDELLYSPTGFHVPATMQALATENPTAWTYKVGDLIGSTPELLIARQAHAAKARVLAGTIDRDIAVTPQLVAQHLTESPKQLFEHQAAVDSLVEQLQPFATHLEVSPEPFVLTLPNVYHLATDVSATLAQQTSILELVAHIHPTAAVGGTPRKAALDAIWDLEAVQHGMDRGLYAGAVGWLDAQGQGEFGIALRGSVIEDTHHVRVYAGGGIVTGSDPVSELAETHAKMRPMKQALRVHAY